MSISGVNFMPGSSPRVQGKRVAAEGLDRRGRIIPACAGKTSQSCPHTSAHTAHPRACGENHHPALTASWPSGSSPRMRGKQYRAGLAILHQGLIPAHAGKTGYLSAGKASVRAHPRACGENAPIAQSLGPGTGSSPRMRGKPTPRRSNGSEGRLIPAHAGKTRPPGTLRHRPPAHPRACGENCVFTAEKFANIGSSPRMRGKPEAGSAPWRTTGLIPAHAGKTVSRAAPPPSPPAHPRACGENTQKAYEIFVDEGSSPRMRGKPGFFTADMIAARLIPAHAGKTS